MTRSPRRTDIEFVHFSNEVSNIISLFPEMLRQNFGLVLVTYWPQSRPWPWRKKFCLAARSQGQNFGLSRPRAINFGLRLGLESLASASSVRPRLSLAKLKPRSQNFDIVTYWPQSRPRPWRKKFCIAARSRGQNLGLSRPRAINVCLGLGLQHLTSFKITGLRHNMSLVHVTDPFDVICEQHTNCEHTRSC